MSKAAAVCTSDFFNSGRQLRIQADNWVFRQLRIQKDIAIEQKALGGGLEDSGTRTMADQKEAARKEGGGYKYRLFTNELLTS